MLKGPKYFYFACALGIISLFGFYIFSNKTNEIQWSSKDGIIASDYTWKKKTVTVCWADKSQIEKINQMSVLRQIDQEMTKVEISDLDKSLIQKKIQEQFTIQSVGIEFTGWDRCLDDDSSDVRLFAFDELSNGEYYLPGEADVGTSCEMFNSEKRRPEIRKRQLSQTGYLFLNKSHLKANPQYFKDSTASLVRVALHEFGHVAGLHHEHFQSLAKDDPNCLELLKADPRFNAIPKNLDNIQAYSEYDPKSIMNSCFLITEDEKTHQDISEIKLSELDKHSLQCVYKSNADYDKSTCKVRQLKK